MCQVLSLVPWQIETLPNDSEGHVYDWPLPKQHSLWVTEWDLEHQVSPLPHCPPVNPTDEPVPSLVLHGRALGSIRAAQPLPLWLQWGFICSFVNSGHRTMRLLLCESKIVWLQKKKSLSLCFSFEVTQIPSDETFIKNPVILGLVMLLMSRCSTLHAFAKWQGHVGWWAVPFSFKSGPEIGMFWIEQGFQKMALG